MRLRLRPTVVLTLALISTAALAETPPPGHQRTKPAQKPKAPVETNYATLPSLAEAINALKREMAHVDRSLTFTLDKPPSGCGTKDPLVLHRKSFEVKMTISQVHIVDNTNTYGAKTPDTIKVSLGGTRAIETKTKNTDTTEYHFEFLSPKGMKPTDLHKLGKMVNAAEMGIFNAQHAPLDTQGLTCAYPRQLVLTMDYDLEKSKTYDGEWDLIVVNGKHERGNETDHTGTVELTITYDPTQTPALMTE